MNWETLIASELALLIFLVWNGFNQLASVIQKGLQSAGLAKLPEGKSKCPSCNDIVWIPFAEVICYECRKKESGRE